jgi:hypothetical protein
VSYAQLAVTVRNATGLDEESSPFAYAARMTLVLVPDAHAANGAELHGKRIHWDCMQPAEAQRLAIARELCRWLIRMRNEPETAAAVGDLYSFMFPSYERPVFSPSPSQHLRLLPPTRVLPRCDASPAAHSDHRLELAGRPR